VQRRTRALSEKPAKIFRNPGGQCLERYVSHGGQPGVNHRDVCRVIDRIAVSDPGQRIRAKIFGWRLAGASFRWQSLGGQRGGRPVLPPPFAEEAAAERIEGAERGEVARDSAEPP
jgi:hypothetical protein